MRVVLNDGRLTEEQRYKALCTQLVGLFYADTRTMAELVRVCLQDGTDEDLSPTARKTLKKFGILTDRPGAYIKEPDGTCWARMHHVLTEETKSIVRTAITDREQDVFHKVNILLPRVVPISLVA